jgi:hypothetical protein
MLGCYDIILFLNNNEIIYSAITILISIILIIKIIILHYENKYGKTLRIESEL